MTLVVNGKNIEFQYAEARLSVNRIAREFSFRVTDDEMLYKVGDKIEMYSATDELLLRGEIEYMQTVEERGFTYAGRNNAKFIVDCYADKTIQVKEGQGIQDVLREIAGGFGLQVTGQATMPAKSLYTVLIGEKTAQSLFTIMTNTGQIISSDANGNLVIEKKQNDRGLQLIYGENIRSRRIIIDSTQEYDRYVVVSQSNYVLEEKQEVNILGEYGSGKFVKVIRSSENLNKNECEALAEKEFYKDRRKSFQYIAELDSSVKVTANELCDVTDDTAGIEESLSVRNVAHVMSEGSDKIVVVLEKKDRGT